MFSLALPSTWTLNLPPPPPPIPCHLVQTQQLTKHLKGKCFCESDRSLLKSNNRTFKRQYKLFSHQVQSHKHSRTQCRHIFVAVLIPLVRETHTTGNIVSRNLSIVRIWNFNLWKSAQVIKPVALWKMSTSSCLKVIRTTLYGEPPTGWRDYLSSFRALWRRIFFTLLRLNKELSSLCNNYCIELVPCRLQRRAAQIIFWN